MATIAQLATIFTVDNSQFKEGMRDSERRAKKSSQTIVGDLKKIGTGFRSGINAVFNFRTAIATLAGGAGIGLLVKNEMQAIDQTNKFARTIGLGTENLVAYRHGANLAGVETSNFDTSMTQLIKRIGEARSNTGTLVTFLNKYDVSLLNTLKAQDNVAGGLSVVADAIKNARNEADAAAIATAAFGRQGVKMAEFFRKDGAQALIKSREEAERLGITFNAFDASQVEMANDAIERMQKSFKATTTQLAIKLAPVIGAIADKITEMQIESRGTFDAIEKGGKAALFAIKALADGVHTLRIGFQGVQVIVQGFKSLVLNVASIWINSWSNIIDFITGKLNVLISGFNKIPGGPKIPLFQNIDRSGFVNDIDTMATESVVSIVKARDELHNMLMEPLPSQAIDQFIADVQEKTKQAREAAGSASMPGISGDSVDRFTEDQERRLEAIRSFTATELELEVQRFEERMELLRTLDESRFAFEGERRQLIEDLEAKHQEKLNEIASRGQSQLLNQYTSFLDGMKKAAESSGAAQVNIMTNSFAQITASGAQESKKLFKLNKAAAIANALVSTYQGMAKALEWGFPMGPIFAAVIGAAGFAQISSIKSQSFQGGGGGVAPSVGGTPAPPVTPVNDQGDTIGNEVEQPGRSLTINIQGNLLGGPEAMQYIADAVRDANDLDMINFNSSNGRTVIA